MVLEGLTFSEAWSFVTAVAEARPNFILIPQFNELSLENMWFQQFNRTHSTRHNEHPEGGIPGCFGTLAGSPDFIASL